MSHPQQYALDKDKRCIYNLRRWPDALSTASGSTRNCSIRCDTSPSGLDLRGDADSGRREAVDRLAGRASTEGGAQAGGHPQAPLTASLSEPDRTAPGILPDPPGLRTGKGPTMNRTNHGLRKTLRLPAPRVAAMQPFPAPQLCVAR